MKLNKNISGTQITDELFQRSSVTAARLNHDTIRANTFAIRTESGGGGTLLVLNTDYTLGGIDSRLTTEAGVNVFTTVAIINATYHNVDLYATYLTVGDYAEAGDSLPNNVKIESVTGNHTVTAPESYGITTVIVNATTATITIPENVPVGGKIHIRKLSAYDTTNTNKIDIVFSGGEVCTPEQLASIEIYGNGGNWLIEKVTATRWEIVSGWDGGVNTDGGWERLSNGTSSAYSKTVELSISNVEGSLFRSTVNISEPLPIPMVGQYFCNTTSSSVLVFGSNRFITTGSTFEGRGWAAQNRGLRDFVVQAMGRWHTLS